MIIYNRYVTMYLVLNTSKVSFIFWPICLCLSTFAIFILNCALHVFGRGVKFLWSPPKIFYFIYIPNYNKIINYLHTLRFTKNTIYTHILYLSSRYFDMFCILCVPTTHVIITQPYQIHSVNHSFTWNF